MIEPPVIRRDGTEFIILHDVASLQAWLEPNVVHEQANDDDYELWDVKGRKLKLTLEGEDVVLRLLSQDPDDSFRQKLAPICQGTANSPPAFTELEVALKNLKVPSFTVLGLWPEHLGRFTSADWHRPWEPKHEWTPASGLRRVPFWRRF